MSHFVLFDLEYTTFEGCNKHGWHGAQKREAVQLAAARINADTLEIMDTLNLCVKPTVNPKLSDYFTALTGITQEQVDTQGVSFGSAYKTFKHFAGPDKCFSHCWNEDIDSLADGAVLNECLALNGLEDMTHPHYINIAPWFKKRYTENNIHIAKQSSGQIATLLGHEKEIKKTGLQPYNALYDIYSLLQGIKHFDGKDLMNERRMEKRFISFKGLSTYQR